MERARWDAEIADDASVDVGTVERLSQYFWRVQASDIAGGSTKALSDFLAYRDELREELSEDDYFLLISGVRYGIDSSRPYFSVFHQQKSLHEALELPPSEADTQLQRAKRNDVAISEAVGDINSAIANAYD